MKKILSIFLSFCFIFNPILINTAYAQDAENEVEINSTNFPDSTFMEKVKEYDLDSNNILSEEEISHVTYMFLNNMKIENLKGIEYFTNLSTLHVDKNSLTTLDLSKNQNLNHLYGNNNALTSIQLPSSLESLELSANKLTELDLSNLTNLKSLYVDNNSLTNLDLSNNPLNESDSFIANYNLLKSITLPNNNMEFNFSGRLAKQLYPQEKTSGYNITWYKDSAKTEILDPESESNITLQGQTLYAEYTPIEYTVQFDANGGEGEMEPQSFTYDKAQQLSTNEFTYSSHEFSGWVSESGQYFSDGQEVSNLTSTDGETITLKAAWQTHDYTGTTYNITLHANGGEGEDVEIDNANYGSEYKLPNNTFTKEHAEFKGWSFAANSNQVIFSDEDNVNIKNPAYTNDSGTLHLYAVWETKTYDVSMTAYHFQNTFKVEHGKTISEPAKPLRAGYTFNGWKNADGDETWDFNNTVSKDLTLYADYTPISYNIVFNGNEANNLDAMNSSNFSINYNQSKVLPKNTYTKQYHTFLGWSLQENGTVDFLDQATIFELTETNNDTINLYAVWSINPAKVTINVDGKKTDINLNQGETLDIETPSKVGYKFSGWKNDKTEGMWNLEDPVTEDMNLTAEFTPISYNIKFNGAGADNDDAMDSNSLKVNYDQKVNLPKNLYQKENYTFVGWATQEDGDVIYNDQAEIVNLSQTQDESITLYAVWKKDVVYISVNDGVNSPYQLPVEKGDTIPESVNITRKGYTLEGWYTDESLESQNKFDLSSPIVSSINLYAKWTLNNYTITFKNIDREPITYTINDVISLETPYKEGYEFLGWVDENGKEISSTIQNSAENINIYANYKKIEDKNPLISSDDNHDKLLIGMIQEHKNKSETILEHTIKNIASVLGNDSELIQKIREAYQLNKNVKGYIETSILNEEQISESEKTIITNALKNLQTQNSGRLFNVLSYFDISVPVRINSELVGYISNLSENITFSFAVPEQLQRDGRMFKILRIHNGEVSVIDPSELSNGILSFQTDRFSTYALAYADSDSNTSVNDTNITNDTDNSNTSDIATWIKTGDTNKTIIYIIFATSLVLLCIFAITNKKNSENE